VKKLIFGLMGLSLVACDLTEPMSASSIEKIDYIQSAKSEPPLTDSMTLEQSREKLAELRGQRQVDAFMFVEQLPEGGGAVRARYFMDEAYMRLDDGLDTSDFAIFDLQAQVIYSVTHGTQSIMVINPQVLPQGHQLPKITFEMQSVDATDLPEIMGVKAQTFTTRVNGEKCEEVVALPHLFEKRMDMFKAYRMVLARHQMAVLDNTPAELRNSCVTSSTALNPLAQFSQGFPIEYRRVDGESRQWVDFKQAIQVDASVFQLPQDYTVFDLTQVPALAGGQ
jgi:hypothetical protein